MAAILELDENLNKQFRVFDAAPQVCTHTLLAINGVLVELKWLCALYFYFSPYCS